MTHASIVSGHAANHESSTSSAAKAYKAKVLAGNNGRLGFDCVLFRSHSHIFLDAIEIGVPAFVVSF